MSDAETMQNLIHVNIQFKFVGSDLTFSNPVKSDGPVETVQSRTCIK
jgi:hypothetical protein